MTGVPVYNVNNNCATGSTALHLAKNFVQGGVYDCVMALGFEKMERGSLEHEIP
jgi:acetyl-CoA acetyltransferase